MATMSVSADHDHSASRHGSWPSRRARPMAVARGEREKVLPDELSAAGLMVPVPSVTKPLACAEYIAATRAGAMSTPSRLSAMLEAGSYVSIFRR
jgi:hypothetical protein